MPPRPRDSPRDASNVALALSAETLESVAARDLSKTEGLQQILKKDMDKAKL